MRIVLKLILFLIIGIVIYTLYSNFRHGGSWTKEALQHELGVTLGLVQDQGRALSRSVSEESGRVLGEMTSRMTREPIMKAITGTIADEVKAIPYNICKPVVENYESN